MAVSHRRYVVLTVYRFRRRKVQAAVLSVESLFDRPLFNQVLLFFKHLGNQVYTAITRQRRGGKILLSLHSAWLVTATPVPCSMKTTCLFFSRVTDDDQNTWNNKSKKTTTKPRDESHPKPTKFLKGNFEGCTTKKWSLFFRACLNAQRWKLRSFLGCFFFFLGHLDRTVLLLHLTKGVYLDIRFTFMLWISMNGDTILTGLRSRILSTELSKTFCAADDIL